MNLSGLSHTFSQYDNTLANKFAKGKSSFQALDKALSSGDLAAAKSAFAEIQKNAPKSDVKRQLPAEFTTLAKALESNDLQGAQSALKSLKDHRPTGNGGFAHFNHIIRGQNDSNKLGQSENLAKRIVTVSDPLPLPQGSGGPTEVKSNFVYSGSATAVSVDLAA